MVDYRYQGFYGVSTSQLQAISRYHFTTVVSEMALMCLRIIARVGPRRRRDPDPRL